MNKIVDLFKDKETFINYTQIIPAVFGIIWVIMLFYASYEAPIYSDELNGRIYSVTIKSRTAYLTLTENILLCASPIAAFSSMLILQLISSHYWKDGDE